MMRFAVLVAEPVLHIVGDGIGHEERPGKLKKRGALDGLHIAPEVAVVVAEVAEPASAGPRLDLHLHRGSIGQFAARTELLQKRFEGYVERTRSQRISCLISRIMSVDIHCGLNHDSSLFAIGESITGKGLCLIFVGLLLRALFYAKQLVLPVLLELAGPLMQRPDGGSVGSVVPIAAIAAHMDQAHLAQNSKML